MEHECGHRVGSKGMLSALKGMWKPTSLGFLSLTLPVGKCPLPVGSNELGLKCLKHTLQVVYDCHILQAPPKVIWIFSLQTPQGVAADMAKPCYSSNEAGECFLSRIAGIIQRTPFISIPRLVFFNPLLYQEQVVVHFLLKIGKQNWSTFIWWKNNKQTNKPHTSCIYLVSLLSFISYKDNGERELHRFQRLCGWKGVFGLYSANVRVINCSIPSQMNYLTHLWPIHLPFNPFLSKVIPNRFMYLTRLDSLAFVVVLFPMPLRQCTRKLQAIEMAKTVMYTLHKLVNSLWSLL